MKKTSTQFIFKSIKILLAIVVCEFTSQAIIGQNISLSGTVKNAASLEAIEGATVTLSGTELSSVTDAQGAFSIIANGISNLRSGISSNPMLLPTGNIAFSLNTVSSLDISVYTIHGKKILQLAKNISPRQP